MPLRNRLSTRVLNLGRIWVKVSETAPSPDPLRPAMRSRDCVRIEVGRGHHALMPELPLDDLWAAPADHATPASGRGAIGGR
jgi:hypothetical protein